MVTQLRLEQVSLQTRVGAQPILQTISCQVMKGDRIAILGPSGAGKTSLLRLLNRLSECSQGTIYFDGQPIQQIPVLQLRRQVVLLPQESKLLGMTVRDTLMYPLKLQGMSQTNILHRMDIWMEQVHVPVDWLNRTEVQLSVGQRQLVAIARALMMQPRVLLLDEPTSALDAGRSAHVLHVLKTLATDQEVTILMVNHQLNLAQQFANRVLYLEQGKLLQDSTVDHLNWSELSDRLIQAEAQQIDEWGD